ncbi:hypothetical protein SPRG_20632 [Saprolegnia parasitica CBS 223.65]|uniref:SAM domain-containing protein n=1 Tax=Saprolegnia parasitica (strain CBS 223.65) TaxID=695850 RepID=A0A067C4Q2_SAPPC|nr:hypothetical protein SPRG_20632 [Saprolegnia parasitica CBS 223.65]KDO25508.1 hypothetical protein SPRG_20632 [Saprolegnia parasitica CBS 223.65]|eukprot:XP_012203742.1 hypothetical protein SPRG_20632 [Saprolegnia parasitica CBS 223.65]
MDKLGDVVLATPRPVPFLLQSAASPSRCIHLQSGTGRSENGDVCHLWTTMPGTYAAQEWFYDRKLLRSMKDPTKCIHLQSGSGPTFNGDVCHLWDIQSGSYPAQEWLLDGKLIRSAKDPTKCIHLKDGSGFDGDKCHLWDVQDGAYPMQEWNVVYLPTAMAATDVVPLRSLNCAQVYQLLSALEFTKHKDMFLMHEINGHALSCCETADELLELGAMPKLKAKSLFETLQQLRASGVSLAFFGCEPLPKRRFRIQSVKCPAKCIHLQSGEADTAFNGDVCHLWDTIPRSYEAQTWIFDGALIKSAKDPTKCIHLKSGTAPSGNGDACHLWDIQPGSYPAQEWRFDGKLLRSVKCPTKCIHLKSGRSEPSNGVVCHLWDAVDGPYAAQEWTLVPC